MGNMRLADDLIDQQKDTHKRQELYQYVLSHLASSEFQPKHNSVDLIIDHIRNQILKDLPQLQRSRFISNLDSLFQLTEMIKFETDAGNLANLSRLEGQLTARMLLLSVPKEENPSQELIKIMTRFARFANNVDSAVDMPRDKKYGEIICNPSLVNRAVVFLTALPDLEVFFNHLKPKPKQISQLLLYGFYTLAGSRRK